MADVNKAASLMGRKSAEARKRKWGKKEFERRMREWGKLGGQAEGQRQEEEWKERREMSIYKRGRCVLVQVHVAGQGGA